MTTDEPALINLLREKGLQPCDNNAGIIQGRLNTVQVFSNSKMEKFCLRTTRNDLRDRVKTYITNLYNRMHIVSLEGVIRYQTIEEQVEKMRRLSQLGISVPEILAHGSNWILMSFLEGTPLTEFLPHCSPDETEKVVRTFLERWSRSHSQGECLWDRCGKNELIQSEGRIGFVDFDIRVDFPQTVPFAIQCNLDLAVGLRACLRYAQHKDQALRCMQNFLTEEAVPIYPYSLPHLSEILTEQALHYQDMGRRPELAAYYAGYEVINDYEFELARYLASFPNRSYEPSGKPDPSSHKPRL